MNSGNKISLAGKARFLALKHALLLTAPGDYSSFLVKACLGQSFIADSSVIFFGVAVKERMTWRYVIGFYNLMKK